MILRSGIFGKRGKWVLAAGGLVCAVTSLSVQADVCSALYERVELSPQIQSFLAQPFVENRIVKLLSYTDDEPFAQFYTEIEAWLQLEKNTGKASRGKAKLRMAGGDPLIKGFFKRDKYAIAARLTVEKPGEVIIRLDLDAARTTSPAAILDLQTMQLALVKKLFDAFSRPGSELNQITLDWRLGHNAPKGFADHLAGDLNFKRTRGQSICTLPVRFYLSLIGAGVGGTAGSFVGAWEDSEIGTGQDSKTAVPVGAVFGGLGGGGVVASFSCRQISARAGEYELIFKRFIENKEPEKTP